MLDLGGIRERAAARAGAATPANPANWLIEAGGISQLAALATGESGPQPPEPLPQRDADDRVRCTACAHYRPASHRCTNHKGAGLLTAAVGPELAELPQRCPGYAPRNP